MGEIEDSEDIAHWLAVHVRLRQQIRNLTLLLAMLFGFSAFQFFNHLNWLNEAYDFAREFTLLLQEQGAREEVAGIFNLICRDSNPECEDGEITVPLQIIPEVSWELERYLQKHHPSRNSYSFQGMEVDFSIFAIATLFLPVIFLFLILSKLRSMHRVAGMLKVRTSRGGNTQQVLNSVFYERVTVEFGEGRTRHAIAATTLLLVLAIGCTTFAPITMRMVLDTQVAIDSLGNVTPLPVAQLNDRTKPRQRGEGDLLILLPMTVCIVSLVFGGLIFASIRKQLGPEIAIESEEEQPSITGNQVE